MYAIWGEDYDNILKESYRCPVCPKCDEPVDKFGDKYHCLCCLEEVEVDEEMKEWFKERE